MTGFASGWGGLAVIFAAIGVTVAVDWLRQGVAGPTGRGVAGAPPKVRWSLRIGTIVALVLAVLGAALTLVRFAALAFT